MYGHWNKSRYTCGRLYTYPDNVPLGVGYTCPLKTLFTHVFVYLWYKNSTFSTLEKGGMTAPLPRKLQKFSTEYSSFSLLLSLVEHSWTMFKVGLKHSPL